MSVSFQDAYLDQLKKESQPVIIYLVNGVQLKGTVKRFDNFTIFLENHENKIQLVYKHAVTTISPLKTIDLSFLKSHHETKTKKHYSEE